MTRPGGTLPRRMTAHARRRPAALLAAVAIAAACARRPPPVGAADRAHLDAMAREHAGEAPTANGSAQTPRQEVSAEEVVYGAVGGRPARGYLARPARAVAGERLPGVVVIHEWWGLNDNVRMMTRRLAGEGYLALAVDLYGGRVATTPEEARAAMGEVMARPDAGAEHLRAGADFLRDGRGAPRLGIVGWCFGGGWALEGALRMPGRVDAAVMYYGRVVADRERLARLDAPLLGLFGGADRGIPLEGVRQMEAALRELGKPATVHVYEGAGHAFANPSGPAYRADVAEDAWRRTTEFLARHLRGS